MITRDMITNLIMKTDLFIAKRGQDINTRRELINAINQITGEDSLDTIYINKSNFFNVPTVVVLPLYHSDFSSFVMNPDDSETCPFGYTIEISDQCFDKLVAEELAAVMIHDILQNVQSDTAKIRFMKAYSDVIGKHNPEDILDSFSDISLSEVTYIMFMEICCRPFRVPVVGNNYTGTDDVLKTMGLGDAYDSYLEKILPMSIDDPEDVINKEIENDYRDVSTIIRACLDKDIRHYYNTIRTTVPLITLEHILGSHNTAASLGFISRKRSFKRRYDSSDNRTSNTVMSESFMNPKTEVEMRFNIDKIISEMRYAESEAERAAILFRIKNLTLKLVKKKIELDKKLLQDPMNQHYVSQLESISNFLDELDMLRDKVVKMEIKTKVWRVYSKQDMPEGYQY